MPFEIHHIDAHADLGLGDTGYIYLMSELLLLPPEKRDSPRIGSPYLNQSNYLSYCLACRWFSKVIYVTHPNYRGDLMPCHFKDFDVKSGVIELKYCDRAQFDVLRTQRLRPVSLEPPTPIEIIPHDQFSSDGDYSFIVLSQSPSFTPPESDDLIPLFKEYMRST